MYIYKKRIKIILLQLNVFVSLAKLMSLGLCMCADQPPYFHFTSLVDKPLATSLHVGIDDVSCPAVVQSRYKSVKIPNR